MSDTLIHIQNPNVLATQEDDEAFRGLSGNNSFLPRLQLFGASSGVVKEGKIPMAHYGLVKGKDSLIDLGNEVDLIPLTYRFKAMEITGDEVFSFFKPKSPEFLRIQGLSGEKDSGCMAGVEFLVWVPEHKEFATFYAANTSSKNEAPKIKQLLGKGSTFKVTYVKGKKNSWHAPVVLPCSTDISELPDTELLNTVVASFCDPKDSEVTTAATPAATSDRVQ